MIESFATFPPISWRGKWPIFGVTRVPGDHIGWETCKVRFNDKHFLFSIREEDAVVVNEPTPPKPECPVCGRKCLWHWLLTRDKKVESGPYVGRASLCTDCGHIVLVRWAHYSNEETEQVIFSQDGHPIVTFTMREDTKPDSTVLIPRGK